jgi:hypothetical protein
MSDVGRMGMAPGTQWSLQHLLCCSLWDLGLTTSFCVLQVAYTRGQAPVTRAAAEDVSRAATWALLEPVGQPAELQACPPVFCAVSMPLKTLGPVSSLSYCGHVPLFTATISLFVLMAAAPLTCLPCGLARLGACLGHTTYCGKCHVQLVLLALSHASVSKMDALTDLMWLIVQAGGGGGGGRAAAAGCLRRRDRLDAVQLLARLPPPARRLRPPGPRCQFCMLNMVASKSLL